jgi:large subunit GTPase 1
VLLITFSDLFDSCNRQLWADYFDSENIQYAFYSALAASALENLETIPESSSTSQLGQGLQDLTLLEDAEGDSELPADDRIRVLSVEELQELFTKAAPDLSSNARLSIQYHLLTSQFSIRQFRRRCAVLAGCGLGWIP